MACKTHIAFLATTVYLMRPSWLEYSSHRRTTCCRKLVASRATLAARPATSAAALLWHSSDSRLSREAACPAATAVQTAVNSSSNSRAQGVCELIDRTADRSCSISTGLSSVCWVAGACPCRCLSFTTSFLAANAAILGCLGE